MTNRYYVDRLDNKAQGVARSETAPSKDITFIAKTLPGETVEADIFHSKKNTHRAKLTNVIETSPERIQASCPHFSQCPSCHLQHTSYDNEQKIKQDNLQHLLRFLFQTKHLVKCEPQFFACEERLHYRNRIQLHYRHKYLGYIDGTTDQVVEVPQCQIILPELQTAFDELFEKNWTKEKSGGGHVELYYKDEQAHTTWDKPYADGGFTQVNPSINEKLCQSVLEKLLQAGTVSLLDLFSGQGNLSQTYQETSPESRRAMVDVSSYSHPDYLQQNLYADDALTSFSRRFSKEKFDTLLIDPPRAGFAALTQWIKVLKPKHVIYVSCNPMSLASDLKTLNESNAKFTVDAIEQFDMFPSTYHYETLVKLTIKKAPK